ncbi:MAG TPA: THUMP domain-containing protein, partial [Nitrososphaera sp.]|nr:THUMP domain-containing protein [Nitrososphaera sp.]
LEDMGDSEAEAEISEVVGLVLCLTRLDPLAVVAKMIESVKSEPWRIRYILRAIPVERVVPTDLEKISETAASLALKMEAADTFRITVEKRHSDMRSKEVIDKVASMIGNKVSLKQPDWIVLIEIVGKMTGISVLRADQIFSAIIEKRAGGS